MKNPLTNEWPSICKQPLFHFFLLGGLGFILQGITHSQQEVIPDNEIHVTQSRLEHLRLQWQNSTGATPTAAEEQVLIEDYIKSEVFVREAKELGLDQDDIIIRRRLAAKFLAVSEHHLKCKPPSDSRLVDWMQTQKDRFRQPERVSFDSCLFQSGNAVENKPFKTPKIYEAHFPTQ